MLNEVARLTKNDFTNVNKNIKWKVVGLFYQAEKGTMAIFDTKEEAENYIENMERLYGFDRFCMLEIEEYE